MHSDSKDSLSNKSIFLFLLLFFTLLTTFFLAKFYLEITNTLENNQQWKSTKVELEKGVIGGVAYFITPMGLAQKKLHLDAWFGHQEVLYKERLSPKQIDFDFTLPKESYFSLIYNKSPESFSGIRFSRSRFYPDLHFKADKEGKFLEKDFLKIENLKEKNHLQVNFDKNRLDLILNGEPLPPIQENQNSSFQIGFRGGPFPVSVSYVKIALRNRDQIIEESFRNKRKISKCFFVLLTVIIFINLLLYAWRKKKALENPFYFLFAFNFIILFASMILFISQVTYLPKNYYFSKYYFKLVALLRNYQTTIETKSDVINRLRKQYPQDQSMNVYRILFIGTSQTWGAGATKEQDTFVRRLEKKFNEESNRKSRYEFINAGISGENSGRLWESYKNEWVGLNPKIVVINLSNNDSNSENFAKYLLEYVELNQSKKIKTIFVLEANAMGEMRDYLSYNHQIMKNIAEEYHLPVINLHECLLKNYDTGFLWWDFVHPTSYGHALAADCIYETLSHEIKKEPEAK